MLDKDRERFWAKVAKLGPDQCWEWQGSLTPKGYGIMRIDGKMVKVHRVSYELHLGSLSLHVEVDHSCRNRRCVNPAHLRPVTRKQNMENVGAHARSRSGVRNVNYHTSSGKWVAQVMHHGKVHQNGLHDEIKDAAVAAKELRDRLFTHHVA